MVREDRDGWKLSYTKLTREKNLHKDMSACCYLLSVPLVDGLQVAKDHLVLAAPQVIGYGYITVRVSHERYVALGHEAQVSHVVSLRLHQLAYHVHALLYRRLLFTLRLRYTQLALLLTVLLLNTRNTEELELRSLE